MKNESSSDLLNSRCILRKFKIPKCGFSDTIDELIEIATRRNID